MKDDVYTISTFALFDQPLQVALHRLISEGWSSIEILLEQPHQELLHWTDRDLLTLMKLGQSKGVSWSLHAPIRDQNPVTGSVQIREQTMKTLLHCLEVADILSCNYVVLHAGELAAGNNAEDDQEHRHRLTAFIQEVLDQSSGSKTILALENVPPHPNLMGWRVEDLLFTVEQINSPRLGLVFDAAHAHLVGPGYCLEALVKVLPYLVGVHISDNFGEKDEHNPVGMGSVPYQQILSILKKANFKGTKVLETRNLEESRSSREKLHGI